ncbi:MAG: hypothetical protein Ct9H300mP11_19720 [Chloroflexota bacterium]|nr:MAG: hypothetical protein Ct9H300mP11_19720 [Chloroflexota bacterium]
MTSRGVYCQRHNSCNIGKIGVYGGVGHVIEYTGEAIRNLSMDGRMTVCNMSIEAGARAGMIAPDQTTFDYLRGRQFAPQGSDFDLRLNAGRLWLRIRGPNRQSCGARGSRYRTPRDLGHYSRYGCADIGNDSRSC